jgi:putative peptide zinc metalloprotease protein
MQLATQPAEQKQAVVLPALREDITLQEAAPGRDGAPHWNLYDPVRNNFYQIGWLEFELLSRWQEGMEAETLCDWVIEQTPLNVVQEDVLHLIVFLQNNELLRAATATQRAMLQKIAAGRKLSVWQWLLHHYLFIRIPLLKPEAFLTRTLPYLAFIFRPSFFLWIGALSVIGVIRVIDQWSEFSRTFMYFFTWEGMVFYGLALGLAKSFHESAHAYTATRYGLRVPTMGIAFMLLMPLLYTDTSEGWKLKNRKARLAIDGAGIIAELCLAGVAVFLWSFLPEGPLKSAAYILAAVTLISTLGINLNPFMRFDGYYLLMDAVDVPNLQNRSFAFGRWQLRKWLLGMQEEIPEPEFESRKNLLILYAYSTWIYRFILFTGIAFVVYYFFFKAAGIILFAVEMGWFVVLPIWKELKVWWTLKDKWQGNSVARRTGVLVLVVLVILALPWHTEISGEGYWQADPYTRMYPPTPARLSKIVVAEGQAVHKGDVLFVLESPSTDWQLQAAQERIEGIKSQLAGTVDSANLLEKKLALEQQLAEAQAELASQSEDNHRLQIVAPHDGVFRDLDNGLYPGAWLGMSRLLGSVVGTDSSVAQVFVNEADVAKIKIGASAKILTRRSDANSFTAVVTDIDNMATLNLPKPMLASPYGGPIAAQAGQKGEMTAHESLYRVTLKTDGTANERQLVPVSARIDSERSSYLLDSIRKAAGGVIRESGL